MGFAGVKPPRALAGAYCTCGIHSKGGGKRAISAAYEWGKLVYHRRELMTNLKVINEWEWRGHTDT